MALFILNALWEHSLIDWASIETILVHKKKTVVVKVTGTSMAPTIFSGDWVQLAPIYTDTPLKNQDIVFVRISGKYYIHRYHTDTGLTKGDNHISWDPLPEIWIGRVQHIEKTFLSRLKRFKYKIFKSLRLKV